MTMTIDDLTEREVRDLVGRTLEPQAEAMRERAHVRLRHQLMTDTISKKTIGRWITEVYETDEVAEQIAKFALRVHSPLKRAVARLAVAYKRKPKRGLRRDNQIMKEETAAWTRFAEPLQYDLHAQAWNRWAIACNTVIVLPIAKLTDDGRPTLDYQRVLRSVAEVVVEPTARAIDAPGILSFMVADRSKLLRAREDDEVVCTVDSQWFTYWNARQKIVRVVEHGLGIFPGAVVRNTMPETLDAWWDPWMNEPVIECDRTVARIVARMNWTRETQSGKQAATTTQDPDADDAIAPETMGDPGAFFHLKGRGVQMTVHDMTVLVDGFKGHIKVLQDEALEVMTGAVSTFSDPDPEHPLEGGAAVEQHAAVQLHQMSQVEFLTPAERRIAYVSSLYAKRLGMEGPDPALVRDHFHTHFAQLPFMDDPIKRQELRERMTKFGTYDQVEARREDTGETPEEAEAALMEIATRRNRLHEFLAERNQPKGMQAKNEPDPALPGEKPEAQTGRFGGRAAPDDEERDEAAAG